MRHRGGQQAAPSDTDQFVLGRGGGESLHGEVGDAVERQVHQLTPEVVLVEVAEEGLVSELDDGVHQVAGGLVLQKDQKWTEKTEDRTRCNTDYIHAVFG